MQANTQTQYDRLDERVRRWIWQAGWTELRDAQARAIPALVDADRDVIIAAATAAGKTEAAFLPILTNLLRDETRAATVLYVSPLKALINDQWERLGTLCDALDIPVIGWHGDVGAHRKRRFFAHPAGVLIITPESLEAMCVNRGSTLATLFRSLRYIVVDELHAFIGSERGMQLQSLMHRIERACGHRVVRVGLSATLGDMTLAARFLRPREAERVEIVDSASAGQAVQIVVKGYLEQPARIDIEPGLPSPELEDTVPGQTLDIARHLYDVLHGSNNLVFPNSRRQVEIYADLLARICEREGVPNAFFPHHGSLSKELRDDTEHALKDGVRAATAICTNTLELGIDIGAVRSVAQIGPPPSVASLRQRMGRSGRRHGEPSIVRCYCVERPVARDADLSDGVRESLVQTIAMIRLMLARWVEPPRAQGMHVSTLVQQILSLIAERGGCRASALWDMLVESGPFEQIDKPTFAAILRSLGAADLLMQDPTGLLLHGQRAEARVHHFEFYSAFNTPDTFRIVDAGRTLGTVPVMRGLGVGQQIVFAGRRWIANEIDLRHRVIHVSADAAGVPPVFDGASAMIHDEVRREMKRVLSEHTPVPFLDATARTLLDEARAFFRVRALARHAILRDGRDVAIATWRGDWINDALTLLLRAEGLNASNRGVAIDVRAATPATVVDALRKIGAQAEASTAKAFARIDDANREKWDWALPDDVKRAAYASQNLDLTQAVALARELAGTETANLRADQ
ncbi:DEAD/DEAH box helicase [Pararobbsia silviterrae]|uniref:DEAD/DEAH box helicase n=1 Tax=Pararobbsia silviterrae TaxID=1792498 RepID=A0A494Y1P1_9BURK|nr:DEAD/DEAH box helicase [Pararobbsia silviterrae]RKP55918.1 DEAD/DEAH box helicase [Pararobbsia silviterrae]